MLLQYIVDQLRLARCGGIGEVNQLHVIFHRSSLRALADNIPEGVARLSVGDHSEAEMRRRGRRTRCRAEQTGDSKYGSGSDGENVGLFEVTHFFPSSSALRQSSRRNT